MAKQTKEEKLKVLEAEDTESEVYLEYIMRIREMTINVNDGGILIMQSGSPPPLPPYKP